MRVLIVAIGLLGLSTSGCKESEGEKVCAQLETTVRLCFASAGKMEPRFEAAIGTVKELCEGNWVLARSSRSGEYADKNWEAMKECGAAAGCDALNACLDKNGCSFIMLNKTRHAEISVPNRVGLASRRAKPQRLRWSSTLCLV